MSETKIHELAKRIYQSVEKTTNQYDAIENIVDILKEEVD